jgi:hypothetical protein
MENGLLELTILGPEMRGESFRMGFREDAEVALATTHRSIDCAFYEHCLDLASHLWSKDYMSWTCRGCPFSGL